MSGVSCCPGGGLPIVERRRLFFSLYSSDQKCEASLTKLWAQVGASDWPAKCWRLEHSLFVEFWECVSTSPAVKVLIEHNTSPRSITHR